MAAELGALIIDGGTQSGVMAMMGEAVARYSKTCQLLGIAPEGKIAHPEISGASTVWDGTPLEPNHSHFVLVESDEWGGETTTMLEVARAFNALRSLSTVVRLPPTKLFKACATDGNFWLLKGAEDLPTN